MSASKQVQADPLKEEKARLSIQISETDPNWIPDARNGLLKFTARIYAFVNGQWVPAKRANQMKKIVFMFADVSKEKGVCMNYPKDANTNPDLFFACPCPDCYKNQDPKMSEFDFEEDKTSDPACVEKIVDAGDNPKHKHHYQKATTKEAVFEATAVVRCEDFGANGVLTVTADDTEAMTRGDTGKPAHIVTIPVDENQNKIADSAPQDKDESGNAAKAGDDNDSTPVGDGTKGDGFTNYEEYRGFIISDESRGSGKLRHFRTDTSKKDLFIYNPDGLQISLFRSASALEICLLPDPDLFNGASADNDTGPTGKTQIVNFNRGYASGGDQHGLRLVKETSDPNLFGVSRGGGPGTPKVVNRVAVNTDNTRDANEPPNRELRTVAHELGHSVGLWHHGEKEKHDHTVTFTDGTTATYSSEPTGGQTSGIVNCIMRYANFASLWCHPDDNNRASHHPHYVPRVNPLPGDNYCTGTEGTEVNAGNDFKNDATSNGGYGRRSRGKCREQLKVKDW